ncbi:MAG: hypothetical protein IKR06_05020, partial [Erysipelotrichaceae bacterium]|nr:hypothetical protein [Erysipelotrichaceae bacterium]
MIRIKLFLILTTLLVFCGCAKQQVEKNTYWLPPITDEDGEMVLLLNTDVRLTTIDPAKESELQKEFNDIVTHYHRLLDPHHYYSIDGERISNLKALNDSYGSDTPLKVDPDLIKALEESFVLCELTD